MTNKLTRNLAIFYCQNVPECEEEERQSLENRYGNSVRLFPMPCSGRIDTIHLLKALEEFADAVYVITCPEGACRYLEGNRRAAKRVERARSIIEGIGLEKERIKIITPLKENNRIALESYVENIMKEAMAIPASPVHEIRQVSRCKV
jgi:F420-non-reducing hydrogenase iron-sulfur subunit